MPEILRSLLVVLIIAITVFGFTQGPITARAIAPSNFVLRRNIWFVITLAAFLANNYWIFVGIAAFFLIYGAKREQNKIALLFSVLFAVPLFRVEISGLGIVNYFFDIDYFRMLSLVVLLPSFLLLRKQQGTTAFLKNTPDKFLAAFLLLGLVRQFQIDSLTNILRTVFYLFIDIFLPYYVASRSLRSIEAFRDALSSFVVAVLIISVIGVVELGKGWLLYSNVSHSLGIEWGFGGYLARAGNLRAIASTGQAIVLGYIITVALGLYLFVSRSIKNPFARGLGYLTLGAGLISPLSRGPWVGAIFTGIIYIFTTPKPIILLAKLIIPFSALFFLLLISPVGPTIIDHLPFVGTIDAENVLFRERLLENSLQVIARNPFFGSYDYMLTPEMEELRAGPNGGIIDVVNSYLAILLSGGLVALALFIGFFISIIIGLIHSMRNAYKIESEHRQLGRALLATIAGILITIYTVSSIIFIPIIYWLIGGLCVAYIQMAKYESVNRTL